MQRISTISVANAFVCGPVAESAVVKKIPEDSNVGGAGSKTEVFAVAYPAHSLQGKVLMQTNSTNGKHTLRMCAFWGSTPNILSRTPIKTHEIFLVPQIYFIHLM